MARTLLGVIALYLIVFNDLQFLHLIWISPDIAVSGVL
jgi:hypothetical protein